MIRIRRFLFVAIVAGIAAGITSTLAQVVLWVLLTDQFPAILWRDTRLAAALVLGKGVLGTGGVPGTAPFAVATAVHFLLSVAYAWVFCAIAQCLAWRAAVALGAVLGASLYFINMYGFTLLFPWFAASRDAITLAAHVVFGMTATFVGCRLLKPRRAGGSRRSRRGARPPAGFFR